MKYDLAIRFPPVRNVQVVPGVIPSEKLVDAFQPASRTHFQRPRFQYLKEVFFVIAMFECAFDKSNHYKLCIAHASLVSPLPLAVPD